MSVAALATELTILPTLASNILGHAVQGQCVVPRPPDAFGAFLFFSEAVHLQGVVLEDSDGRRHGADFVAAAGTEESRRSYRHSARRFMALVMPIDRLRDQLSWHHQGHGRTSMATTGDDRRGHDGGVAGTQSRLA